MSVRGIGSAKAAPLAGSEVGDGVTNSSGSVKNVSKTGQFGKDRLPDPPKGATPADLFFLSIANALSMRREFLRELADPRRDLADECGYPKSLDYNAGIELYREQYLDNGIARRALEIHAKECWQVVPEIIEDDDVEVLLPFEKAFQNLSVRLHGQGSYYRDPDNNPLWEYLFKADVESGIGHFGVVFLGIDDKLPYDQPAAMRPPMTSLPGDAVEDGEPVSSPQEIGPDGEGTVRNLLFVRVYPEYQVQIDQYETDRTSPRYGFPLIYSILGHDPRDRGSSTGPTGEEIKVHWTRIVHVCFSDIFHTPILRPILERCLDVRKTYGSSAEMYYKGAFPGLSIEALPQLAGEVSHDTQATKDELEQYMNGLQRYLFLVGVSAKSLAPQVVSPAEHLKTYIEAICIARDVPTRIFMGSERGELASEQDDQAWNDRVSTRQNRVVTPRIIVPTINRLIDLYVLPIPPNGYKVKWPAFNSHTDTDKATIALTKAQAIGEYVAKGGETVFPLLDFLTRIMGYTQQEAEAIIDNAMTRTGPDQLASNKFSKPEPTPVINDPTKPKKNEGGNL